MKMNLTTEEILEELRKKMVPEIPEHAITKKMFINSFDEENRPSMTTASRWLNELVENESWNCEVFKNVNYYWPPDDHQK